MAASIVTVLLVAVGAWFLFGGEKPEQSSEQEARSRLGTSPTGSGTQPTSLEVPHLGQLPGQGVYRFTGKGTEHTSFPPLTEQQGPDMPATLALQDNGCWTFRIDYNTHHWQDWTYCSGDGRLREVRGSSFARRAFGTIDIDNTSTFTCDPEAVIAVADEPANTSHPRTCSGSGNLLPEVTRVTGTMTDLGEEPVDVQGQSINTIHVRYDLTYAGGQAGTEKNDFWFRAENGMPVKNERHLTVETDTPIGHVTYTEDADFLLQSLTPV